MMVRDKNIYPWRDFWDAFRQNWKQGILFGVPCTVLIWLASIVLGIYLVQGVTDSTQRWVFLLLGMASVLALGMGIYIFLLVGCVELATFSLLKNAFLLVFLGSKRTLSAVGILVVFHLGVVLLFPLSLLWLLSFHMAICSLIASLWAWPVIQQYAVLPTDSQE